MKLRKDEGMPGLVRIVPPWWMEDDETTPLLRIEAGEEIGDCAMSLDCGEPEEDEDE